MAGMRIGARTAGARRARSARRARGAQALGRPSLALGVLFTGLLLAGAFAAIDIQRNALARQAADLHAQIAGAQATNARLAADVATKQTSEYVIDRARDYGYVRPGEALIGVQQEPKPPALAATVASPTRAAKWLALFFGTR